VYEDGKENWLTYEQMEQFVTGVDFSLMLLPSMTQSILDRAEILEAEKFMLRIYAEHAKRKAEENNHVSDPSPFCAAKAKSTRAFNPSSSSSSSSSTMNGKFLDDLENDYPFYHA
jgi:hypothetical protein